MPKGIPDPTKAAVGAITMVHEDYDLLETWVRYYGDQLGREHLYVISHGDDPKHRRIAAGATVIGLPRDPTMQKFERRRWFFLTHFANGLLRYFNWLIVGDTDEIVTLDPDIGHSLPEYLGRYSGPEAPRSISPFGIEIVHNPQLEPDPLVPGALILPKRRLFRLNANYAKPCIIRHDVSFTNGGHANNHQPRVLDDHLILMHLRFYDFDRSCARLKGRALLRKALYDGSDAGGEDVWAKSIRTYEKLALQEPKATTIEFPEFRRQMVEAARDLHDGHVTFFGGGRSKELYRLPDRFTTLF